MWNRRVRDIADVPPALLGSPFRFGSRTGDQMSRYQRVNVETDYPCVEIPLEPWEIQQGIEVGGKRWVANLNKKDAPHYDRNRMEPDLLAQPAAVWCEAAVAKHLGAYYDWSAWDAGQHDRFRANADLGGLNIEVRRVRTQPRVTVRRRDVDADRIVYAAWVSTNDPRRVLVYGHIRAAQGWDVGKPPQWDTENSRQVELTHLTLGAE